MTTREIILTKALEMFNKKGIEYVGLRELATILNIRVSNITYYFPTKDHLVIQLANDLNKFNSELLIQEENMTMLSFLKMMRKIFENQLKYRCLLLSIVHMMEQNKEMSARHKQTQKERNKIFKLKIVSLANKGYLKIGDGQAEEHLASILTLVARFWISEAAISFRKLSPDEQVDYYLSLIAMLLSPYATVKAKKEIEKFFAVTA